MSKIEDEASLIARASSIAIKLWTTGVNKTSDGDVCQGLYAFRSIFIIFRLDMPLAAAHDLPV
jgi:hypothetical protein